MAMSAAEKTKRYEERHPERVAAYRASERYKQICAEKTARYRERHPEKIAAYRAANKARQDAEYRERNRAKIKARQRAWEAANKDKIRDQQRASYAKNPDAWKRRSQQWAERHPDRLKEIRKVSNARQYAKDPGRSLRWAKENSERHRERIKRWMLKNRAALSAKQKRREALKLSSCPAWADLCAIRKFYDTALAKTKETGVQHHVDHIVPLKSPIVCGFHVEHNLQVIPAVQNLKKGNRAWPDMPEGG